MLPSNLLGRADGSWRVPTQTETSVLPGSNGAGIITEIGAAVERVKVGDRVSAGYFFGTYAEELVTDDKIALIPRGVSLDQAAALRIGHGTALFALETRGQLRSGEVVVVTGAAGGVGLATVDVARLLGATVIACVGSKAKAQLVQRHGAHYAIDYSVEDVKSRILEITGGRGGDVVLDVVGGEMYRKLMSSMAFGGRLLVVGFADGAVPAVQANIALLKNVSVCGVFFGAWSGAQPAAAVALHGRVLEWCERKLLDPHISRVYALDSAIEAMRFVGSREATGRVLLRMGAAEGVVLA